MIHVSETTEGKLSPISIEATRCSVIITHYNYASFMRNAIKSVLEQTHQNFECIIVDDASEIGQIELLDRIAAELKDKRIKIVHLPENKGQTLAIFEGLRHASGDF